MSHHALSDQQVRHARRHRITRCPDDAPHPPSRWVASRWLMRRDDQVDNELRKMTAFIKQEAMEKAREIEIKANEEFEIEKSKLVRQETDAIDAQYEKKFKQATMSQQITRSTVANKTRLKVLGARQELLDGIFETAAKQLADGAKDKARYQVILKGLILEGFYALNEPELQLRARKADFDVVEKAALLAADEYKKEMGKAIVGKINKENPLPDDLYAPSPPILSAPNRAGRVTNGCDGRSGGVIVIGGNGKIDVNNTFEARLELLKDSAAPAVRHSLFGKNPNRKFFD
ncbi:vacuolar ATP synthase subunit E [Drechmeria coniospora]|uniref:Vacuolar ATP synthase subunit E n=1 Tax=Drechmeria coniospora TaxID=98403 RepID=A0A151GS81_DRECN|nr:vacuolar ATP synthase subunit E [Drechmeria coniospora]KYK59921.1 vacuolar ATP synthase subunit E [Drechmeria coniospora]